MFYFGYINKNVIKALRKIEKVLKGNLQSFNKWLGISESRLLKDNYTSIGMRLQLNSDGSIKKRYLIQ